MTFMGYEWYDDVHLLPTYGVYLLAYFGVLILSIVFHELGHWLYFKIAKVKTSSRWLFFTGGTWIGLETEILSGSEKHLVESLWWGSLSGLIPIAIASIIFLPVALLAVPYGYIIKSDLKELFDKIEFEDD